MKKIPRIILPLMLIFITITSCKKEIKDGNQFDSFFGSKVTQEFIFDSKSQTIEISKASQIVCGCSADIKLLDDNGRTVAGSYQQYTFGEEDMKTPLLEADASWAKIIFGDSKILIQVPENTSNYKRSVNFYFVGPKISDGAILTNGQILITQDGIKSLFKFFSDEF